MLFTGDNWGWGKTGPQRQWAFRQFLEETLGEELPAVVLPGDNWPQGFEEAFGAHVPEYVLSFTQLLCEKGHIRLFGECADEYEKMYTALKAVSDARVVSAVALTDGEKSALMAKLEQMTGNLVVPTYETDPSLIGGVVIYVGDTVIDGSLKSRLKDIKEVIGR